jgi:hypothetical protein
LYSQIKSLLELKIKKLDVYEDSILIICQVIGEWKIKKEKLRSYEEYLSKLGNEFGETKFTYMRKDKNQFLNALVTLASITKIDYGNRMQPISIEIINSPTHYYLVEGEVDGNLWYNDDIK